MMETVSIDDWRPLVILATAAVVISTTLLLRKTNNNNHKSDIPEAPGGIPLIGHALAYQADPPSFLASQKASIFRINLAGRHMIVIGSDRTAMRRVESLPESVASSRKAVSDIGFEYTLGKTNVFKGTDWHKRILKDCVYGQRYEQDFLPAFFQAFDEAQAKECICGGRSDTVVEVPDLFQLSRRITLRAMLDVLVGPSILESDDNHNQSRLLDELMNFQDCVEDATAKAAVLPRSIALPLCLWPTERKRKALQSKLAQLIETDKKAKGAGPWLKAFQDDDISAEEAAELIVGLVFAAHKNPSIGAAQTFCFLQTQTDAETQARAKKEAEQLRQDLQRNKSSLSAPTLAACVLETMRVTAHSLGAIRTAMVDFDLKTESGKTYKIRKDAVLAVSHITPHRDPAVWGRDASKFRLNRWKDDSSSYLTTFSGGIHKCPGEKLALEVMQLLVATWLLRGVELKAGNTAVPDLCFERATLAQRKGKVPVSIKMLTAANGH